MYSILRKILFLFDAELIHEFSVHSIKIFNKIPLIDILIKKCFCINDKRLERSILGLKFKNPVGLAAGFDKNAECYNEFSNFGFGFIEIGTVTPKAQPGNSKPRLFRLKADQALINRMGFNNLGAKAIVQKLRKRKSDIIVGGNIGKNTLTPNDQAVEDYN